jgi:glycosyltransferase involved in cell wall biosynthesis
MKIHFDNVSINAKTGPNVFAGRLARALFETGHEVTFESKNADISLVFIEPSGNQLCKKKVQRLDGIWFKPTDFLIKNQKIKSLYESADGVIYQSHFDKNMCEKWWTTKAKSEVVYNGIDIDIKQKITFAQLAQIRQTYDKVFVCSANWHKQKRLNSNFELFFSCLKNYPNSCLVVMGSNPDVIISSPHVYYTGSVPQEVYLEMFSIADWVFHLAWADHCPNVIVEALSQGTPVVCSSVGGTKELIGNYGIILEDEKYDYELYDYDNPPRIKIPNNLVLPNRKDLDYTSIQNIDIKHTAKKYIQFFEALL